MPYKDPQKAKEYHRRYMKVYAQYHKHASTSNRVAKERYLKLVELRRAEQDNLCPVCGKALSGRLSLDHDHKTLQIRGYIHQKCNILLGAAHDDVELLKSAIVYLEKFKGQTGPKWRHR